MPADPYLSQIALFGFGFVPRGWAACNGQLLAISQNAALFALIGTTYGGNGTTNFALPNLQSRAPLGYGQGPGLTSYSIGEILGIEAITLTVAQIPAHTHPIDTSALTATGKCSSTPGTQRTPVGGVPAAEAAGVTATYSNAAPDASMSSGAVTFGNPTAGIAGSSQPHENRQPSLAVSYCIAMVGIFPSRN
jgi:microcystin-dependent protein